MKLTEHIATNKASEESYRYLLKISWQVRYYSCEMANCDREWFKSLSDARRLAISKGSLATVISSIL